MKNVIKSANETTRTTQGTARIDNYISIHKNQKEILYVQYER